MLGEGYPFTEGFAPEAEGLARARVQALILPYPPV